MAVSAPIIAMAGGNIIMGVQQTIDSKVNIVLNQVMQLMHTTINAATRTMSTMAGRTAEAVARGASISGVVGVHELNKINLSVMKSFVNNLVKIASSPNGYIIAILMYKVIDYMVPCSEKPLIDRIEDAASLIESFSISIPSIEVPRIDLGYLVTLVDLKITEWISSLASRAEELPEPRFEAISIPCPEPPQPAEWFTNVAAAFLKTVACMLCNVLNNLLMLGASIWYGLSWIGYIVLKGLTYIGVGALTVLKWICLLSIRALEAVINAGISFMESFINSFTFLTTATINVFLSLVVKIPATLVLRYVLKPFVSLFVTVASWFKENVKRVACYYLKIAPWIAGAAGLKKGAERRGLTGALIGGLSGFIVPALIGGVIVPECSIAVDPSAPAPELVGDPFIPEVELTSRELTAVSEAHVRTVEHYYTTPVVELMALSEVPVRAPESINALTPSISVASSELTASISEQLTVVRTLTAAGTISITTAE